MLEMTASLVEEDAALAKDRRYVEDIISQTKKDGYASSVGGTEAGISAIALPIQGGDFCAVEFGVLGKVSVGFS